MKLIREGRFGPPKAFKTGAIVGTYPKPMLVFSFDNGGLDVIPSKGEKASRGAVPLDITYEDIIFTGPDQLKDWVKKPAAEQPKVLAVQCSDARWGEMSDAYRPDGDRKGFESFFHACNDLLRAPACPWKTIVVDPITGLTEIVHRHFAATNSKLIEDARKWAPAIGYQVLKTIGTLTDPKLNCHFVATFHSTIDKNELSSEVFILPMVPSAFARDRLGGVFQQWFYACKEGEKPVIYTTDRGLVKGIGARWPGGLPAVCGADFRSIYGGVV